MSEDENVDEDIDLLRKSLLDSMNKKKREESTEKDPKTDGELAKPTFDNEQSRARTLSNIFKSPMAIIPVSNSSNDTQGDDANQDKPNAQSSTSKTATEVDAVDVTDESEVEVPENYTSTSKPAETTEEMENIDSSDKDSTSHIAKPTGKKFNYTEYMQQMQEKIKGYNVASTMSPSPSTSSQQNITSTYGQKRQMDDSSTQEVTSYGPKDPKRSRKTDTPRQTATSSTNQQSTDDIVLLVSDDNEDEEHDENEELNSSREMADDDHEDEKLDTDLDEEDGEEEEGDVEEEKDKVEHEVVEQGDSDVQDEEDEDDEVVDDDNENDATVSTSQSSNNSVVTDSSGAQAVSNNAAEDEEVSIDVERQLSQTVSSSSSAEIVNQVSSPSSSMQTPVSGQNNEAQNQRRPIQRQPIVWDMGSTTSSQAGPASRKPPPGPASRKPGMYGAGRGGQR